MNLQEQLANALAEGRKAVAAGNAEEAKRWQDEARKVQGLIKAAAEFDTVETEQKSALGTLRPSLPGLGTGHNADNNPAATEAANQKAMGEIAYTIRFGEDDAVKAAVMKDIAGVNYKSLLSDQVKAFSKFLRQGDRFLDRDEFKLLNTQIFPAEDIAAMIKGGYDVAQIKATMVEAQGTLGGFAVPPVLQSEIIRRLPGLTAVRGGGATVINLTTGNSTEIVEITGGNDRYTSGIRGAWGTETQDPVERNLTLGQKSITADIYTYKIPMSQSLVEDATNLVAIIQDEAANTLAMDEDEAFLIGDGIGKPLGIMPGGINALGLNEVNTGNASAATADGVKRLKRGIAAQYRRTGVYVGNSDTFGAIELLVDGNGNYLIVDSANDLTDQDMLLKRRVFESEAMPDIAAGTYPLLFGNMSGYWIVERSGLTVARYQDSGTGINKVEYQFRRRVGGRVVKPWMFALQKVVA